MMLWLVSIPLMAQAVSTASDDPEYPSTNEVLEEVIVTAQRRPEPLASVPIAMTVVTGQTLQDIAARDLSAIAGFAPNVSLDGIVTSGGTTASSIHIRGIGQSDILQTTDPGVGLFVDGVYMARAVGSLLDVADIERVEVLRGPQGTLYGRNTIGGAINVVTRPPADDLASTVRLTLGSDHRVDGYFRFDAPFSERLRTKLSVASFDQDGYVHRPTAGDALGDRHRRVARAQLVYEPTDALGLTIAGDYTSVKENGVPTTLLRVVQVCPAGQPVIIGPCDSIGPPGTPGQTYLFNNVPTVNLAAGGEGVGTSVYDQRYVPSDAMRNAGTDTESSTLDLWGLAVTLDWRLARSGLRSITAWRGFDARFIRDADASPFRIILPGSSVDQRQFTQELQWFGSGANLEWLIGAFYLDETADDDSDFDTASFTLQSGGRDIISRSHAIFGQATWHLADTLAMTAGARYTWEYKAYTPTQQFTSSVTGRPPAGLVVIPAEKNTLDDSEPTWRAALEHTPGDDMLLYLSWSTGFKSGGFVQRNQVPMPALPTFGPETLEVFELGARTELNEGRTRVSAALFSGDYEGIQVRVIEPMGFAPVTANAGDARIRGGEVEFETLVGDHVRLNGGLGYLDGEYTHIQANAPDISLASKLPDAPEWTANLGVIGTVWLAGASLYARVDWRYRSENYNDTENTPELRQDAVNLLDASVGWACDRCSGPAWSAHFGVTNLTDELYLVSGNMLAVQGPIAGSYARLREWYLAVTAEF